MSKENGLHNLALLASKNHEVTKNNIVELLDIHESKDPYPDLIINFGKNVYMPMHGIPPTYLTYAEIEYGGRINSLDIFSFADILLTFSNSQQRNGK